MVRPPPQKRRRRKKPQALVGSAAFGEDDQDDRPMGSAAFGNPTPDHPLRGALLFGNDPEGSPRGSESIGGPNATFPLRGALLFGNSPSGAPTGSDAFGGASPDAPLRGALRVGNDPAGEATGSEAFGTPTMALMFRGSQAFGSPDRIPEKLYKDVIGYDFGGVLLKADEGTMAGIRKDPMDAVRVRVVKVLQRLLDMEVDKLRQGLHEKTIKWGRLKDPETSLDRALAEELRRRYRRAPREILGIGHVRDLLEETERMHTFELRCAWNRRPVTLTVEWDGEVIAAAETRYHNEHTYFEFRAPDGETLGYADTLVPGTEVQVARVRGVNGGLVATFTLLGPKAEAPSAGASSPGAPGQRALRFTGEVRDADENVLFVVEEALTTPKLFKANFVLPGSGEAVGVIEDRLDEANVRCSIQLDLSVPQELAWALAAILADLARLRRGGWPEVKAAPEEVVPTVREALGVPRSGGR